MKTKFMICLVFTLLLIINISGCKKDEEKDCTPVTFSGLWMGTRESNTYGLSGTFTANIIQNGTVLSGTITIPEIDVTNTPA